RKDSLAIYQEQKRPDLARKEEEEIRVIERFLPRQLEGDALKEAVSGIIAESGATGPADIGKVMGLATKRLAGQADGKSISAVAKELLSR
ncbi:MAG TPA: GatB/YqeY domain-containing protein, partial [Puia sp.]|nr:GatB/YqeY domain-containing protein [Puia sp.]